VGCETNTTTDNNHCGQCNNPCPQGQVCNNSVCVGVFVETSAVNVNDSTALDCDTDQSYRGRKVAMDGNFNLYVAMNCQDIGNGGGHGVYVGVSTDRGLTYSVFPVVAGLPDATGSPIVEIAIEGGAGSTAYVAYALTDLTLQFSRSTNAGQAWSTPVPLATNLLPDIGIGMASDGPNVYVSAVEDDVAGLDFIVARSTDSGQNFVLVDDAELDMLITAAQDILVDDGTSGPTVYAVAETITSDIAFGVARSTNGGSTFGNESTQLFALTLTDSTLAGGNIYVAGIEQTIRVIPDNQLGTSTTISGFVLTRDGARSVSADSEDNVYFVGGSSDLQAGETPDSIILQRIPVGTTTPTTFNEFAECLNPDGFITGTFPHVVGGPPDVAIVAFTQANSQVRACVVTY
jgi:hypothetical protein